MNEVEKLRALIPHWIEHNDEHASEFRRWAGLVEEVSPEILAAANMMTRINRSLDDALEKLGGPVSIKHVHE